MAEKPTIRKEMTPAELSLFFANLELIYHSGLTPADGFDILKQGAGNSLYAAWLDELYRLSLSGLPLSACLEKAGGIPAYALSLLRIAEETGKLEDTCLSLRNYYEKRDELSRALRSALVYPLTMVFMVLVVVIVLLTQAMPVFDQVFNQLGLELTGLAGSLLAIGQGLRSSALIITIVLVAIAAILLIARLIPAGRRLYTLLYERAPITGDISFKMSLQRFALAMSTMLNSGLDMDVALELAEPLLENSKVADKVGLIHKDIKANVGFQAAVEKSRIFPPEEMSLLAVGFRSGADARVFDQVGNSLANTTERKLERIIGALEPALVGFMCVLVGIILLSVMLPLLGVLSNI
ncbi:MAG: type II secretion system F family protein [Coriobacteriia bacterium]|nr:type II secretion system F family protein [Coriobacteriia bacterium]